MLIRARKGRARYEVPTCLGVYRMVKVRNDDRPVYKQDGGEHYLYFHETYTVWMVGARPGHDYGWLRSTGVGADAVLPYLCATWQYQPLAREGSRHDPHWKEDDKLRVEMLGGE